MEKYTTFSAYVALYLNERVYEVAPSTLTSEKSKANNLNKLLGKRDIASITHSDIRQLNIKLHKRFTNKTINAHYTILRAVFTRAERDGVIERSPMAGIENLPTSSEEPIPFTKSELRQLRKTPAECDSGKNAFLLDFLTGLRISELIALSWGDINWDRRELYVRRAKVLNTYKVPKTKGSVRTVELSSLAIEVLQAQFEITGKRRSRKVTILQRDNKSTQKESLQFVFINSKTNQPFLNAKQYGKTFFTPFLKSAGVSHRGASQLRHTFASQCLTAGISKEWIARQMGHEGTNMIDERYGRWLKADAPDCAEATSRHLADVFGSQPERQSDKAVQDVTVPREMLTLLNKLQQQPQLLSLLQELVGGGV